MNSSDIKKSAQDIYFMGEALKEAERAAQRGEVPVGALLVYQGQIIARQHNQVQSGKNATLHAEKLVIDQACQILGTKYIPEATLYVTLEPCPMCAAATYLVQLKEVVYGATDPKRGVHLFSKRLIHPKTTWRGGVEAARSQRLLQSFFKQLRLRA